MPQSSPLASFPSRDCERNRAIGLSSRRPGPSRFGLTVDFERRLAEVGVQLINAAPAHPQTLGKLERFHRTLKEWLAEERPAADLEQLQLLLDRFRSHYNEERPHQGIADATPAERYFGNGDRPVLGQPRGELAPAASDEHPSYPPHSIIRKANRNGIVSYDGLAIILPYRFRGASVRVLAIGELIHIDYGDELVRVLVPDRSRHYQPLGRRRRKER